VQRSLSSARIMLAAGSCYIFAMGYPALSAAWHREDQTSRKWPVATIGLSLNANLYRKISYPHSPSKDIPHRAPAQMDHIRVTVGFKRLLNAYSNS
jgi:hypothetical protein